MFSSCDDDTVGKVRKGRIKFAPCLRAGYATDQYDVASAAPSVLIWVCYQPFSVFFSIMRSRMFLLDTRDVKARWTSFLSESPEHLFHVLSDQNIYMTRRGWDVLNPMENKRNWFVEVVNFVGTTPEEHQLE